MGDLSNRWETWGVEMIPKAALSFKLFLCITFSQGRQKKIMIIGFSLVRSTLLLVIEKTSIQEFLKVRC